MANIKETDKSIYKLVLHEQANSTDWKITRVPGGWVYQNRLGTAFVPFNNEFQERSNPTL